MTAGHEHFPLPALVYKVLAQSVLNVGSWYRNLSVNQKKKKLSDINIELGQQDDWSNKKQKTTPSIRPTLTVPT